MTALCGGATSSAKPGISPLIYIVPSVIGAALNNIPTPTAMLIAGAVGALTYEATVFCTSDPPAMPTITLDDLAALLDPLVVDQFIPARQKFQDLIANYLWVQMCQCDAGANPPTPTAPTALNNFDGTPPIAGVTVQRGCIEAERVLDLNDVTPNNPIVGTGQLRNFSDRFGLIAGPNGIDAHYPLPFITALVPATATHYQIIVTMLANAPGVANSDLSMPFFNAGGTILGSGPSALPVHNGDTITTPINAFPTGASYFRIEWAGTPHPVPTLDFTLRFYCNNQTSGTVVQPCCPPDPVATATLQQILGYVTLLQRQIAPFAYVSGASHSVSGHGEIAVQGLIGCRVTLAALDSDVGVDVGDPNNLWQAGWINWGNADGFSDRRFLTSSPFVSFPSQAGQYTRIGYSLPRSLSATLLELRREA